MNYVKLSKEISYTLRHAPWEYELELDENGWVDIEQLLDSLKLDKNWTDLTVTDIEEMIEQSEKTRHEISNGKIRALYGHSTPARIKLEEKNRLKYCFMEQQKDLLIILKKMVFYQ